MARERSLDVDLGKLCTSIKASRQVLEPFRNARREAVRRYAGDQWNTETSFTPRPVNFLSLYLQIMMRSLVSNDPQVTLKTMERQYRKPVRVMQNWVNPYLKKIKIADALQRGGVDALYGFHCMKVALATPAESEVTGWTVEFGQPFCDVIDLDDWAEDPHCRVRKKAAWMGHRSRVRVDSLKNSKLYDAAMRKKVVENPDRQFNEPGDEKTAALGGAWNYNSFESEAYEYCDIWEIYLPMEKLIVTLLSEDGGTPKIETVKGKDAAFDVRPWVGPYCGPYHFLNLMPPVSNNSMSKGPVQDLMQMDEALNGLVNKLINQAKRQKEILATGSGADGDAARIQKSGDGDIVRCDHPEAIRPMAFGGANPNNQAFVLGLWDFLNKVGGNLELVGGLGAQSKTATQDKLLNANSSTSIKWMQQEMVKHTSSVIDGLLWFAHHHPTKEMLSYQPISGLANPIPEVVTPEERASVPYEGIVVDVSPYTLQHQTPEERLAFLNQVVMQIVTPLTPMLQQYGLALNVEKYLEIVSELGNSPDLTEIITNLTTSADGPPESDGPQKPGQTERTYNRINASEKTNEGQSKAMQQALVGQSAGGSPSANGQYSGAM